MTVHDRPRVPLTRENELDLLLIAAYVKGALDHTQDTYPVGHLEAVARDYVSSVPLPEWGRSIVDKEKRRRIEAIVDDYANGYSPRILREVSALILDICALHTPPPVATATVVDATGRLLIVTDDKGFVTLHEPNEDGEPGDLVASVWRDDWLPALAAASNNQENDQ